MSRIDDFRPRVPAPRPPAPKEAVKQIAKEEVRPSPGLGGPRDVGPSMESAVAEGAVLAKLRNVMPLHDPPVTVDAATPPPPAPDPREVAVSSQVEVDQAQATSERETAAASVQGDAQALHDQANHILQEGVSAPEDPDCKVAKGVKDGVPFTTETHYGKDGKPDRVTTVSQADDGTLTVATEADGKVRVQVLSEKEGKTVLDDRTIDTRNPLGPNPIAQRHAETDGQTTAVATQVYSDGTMTGTQDTWSTQTGTGGIRGEVSEGFDPNATTEVHSHSTLTGSEDGVSSSATVTYSQGNHRVSRNDNVTFPDGDRQVSWTQEEQVGNDYRAQTTIEGHPDVLIQVNRHADPAAGTLTEDTVRSNPIDGSVQQQAHVDRSYDDQGRLTHQHERTEDSDGNTAQNDYAATYTANADGSTTVHETTTADVSPKDGPHRVTTEQVDSTDTTAGRQVNGVHTQVLVNGQQQLKADSDGSSHTVEVGGQTLHFTADGLPADEATQKAVMENPQLMAGALAGLTAIQMGAATSATGTTLTGPFADHAAGLKGGIEAGTQFLGIKLEMDGDPDELMGIARFMGAIGGGTDGASVKQGVLNGDVVRYIQEGKTLVVDALNAKKLLGGKQTAWNLSAEAADEARAQMGTFSRAFGVAGVVGGLATGAFDTYKIFTAKNGLDRADAILDAGAGFGTAAVGIAALAEGGPPGWVAAAACLAIQAVVTEGHNIVDDARRGHPEEAQAELQASLFGTPLAGLLLHAWFKHEDADELRTHPLDGALPHL